ncbi:MAG: pseudouridine synthase [Bacteroidota bacterium]
MKQKTSEDSSGRQSAIRLNKFIANAGVCSRRDADQLISGGEISINGSVVTALGTKVLVNDIVTYKGRTLRPEKLIYVLLNKPKDFITTMDDPQGRRTVMELVKKAGYQRIYPVGRLDRNTTGLLVLTNDGELSERLAHPSNNIKKIYSVEVDKRVTKEHILAIQHGVELDDGVAKVDELAILSNDSRHFGLEIHIGKNRVVRRIFEHFGYEVIKLDRVLYAGLDKQNLPRGKWRYLSEREVRKLKGLR